MSAPLADRLRPQTLDDVVGQQHLLAQGKALRRIIDSGQIPNMVFYGPSGVGKTTLATMIAKTTNRKLVKMNGTTASISDIKDVISNLNTFETMNGVLLYLDEIQYFNKKQQQILLEFIENGQITLIASTTENPLFVRKSFTSFRILASSSTINIFKASISCSSCLFYVLIKNLLRPYYNKKIRVFYAFTQVSQLGCLSAKNRDMHIYISRLSFRFIMLYNALQAFRYMI